ncbi:unnamed protein product [Microthlaspi erraticum]|uniref:Uncharacterized protein n=1 Tax=Microthlaspi erraticum TaxID=1685480 RepID=A0A6D2I0U0_9BRAS|nr:unnamed protein product [Microthlaspi erraticum]
MDIVTGTNKTNGPCNGGDSKMEGIKPSKLGHEGSRIWLAEASGDYSVKTGYHVAFSLQQQEDMNHQDDEISGINWNKDVWKGKTSQKLKVFLWKLCSGALALGENLLNRGIESNATCNRCGDLETRDHFLLHCAFAKRTWELAPIANRQATMTNQPFIEILQSSKTWISLPPTGLTGAWSFPWIAWSLWTNRNNQIFEDRGLTPMDTVTKAMASAREWERAQQAVATLEKKGRSSLSHQSADHPKIVNVDAAWRTDTRIAGIAWSFSDSNQAILEEGNSTEFPVLSSLAAEAIAIREAMIQAKARNWTNLCLRSDSQTLVRAIRSNDKIAEIFGVLRDIKSLASSFVSISVVFIPRAENTRADFLAKAALASFVTPYL